MIDAHIASLIKGMIIRGDKQHDIAACFGENGGRVAEIKAGVKWPDVKAASVEELPPAGPYPSPYELHVAGRSLWAVRVALQAAAEKTEIALRAVGGAERRLRQSEAEAAE